MVAGIFHPGSGLGNQLFRYIATRTIAEDNGWDFGMIGNEYFKGSFIDIDLGLALDVPYAVQEGGRIVPMTTASIFSENKVIRNGVDVRGYDYNVLDIQDNTIIDGEFQDEKYWGHKLPEIAKWLRTEPLFMPNDLCILNFRGGEYKYVQDLFLPREYWDLAIDKMLEINPMMRFMVVTDDVETASQMFPGMKINHDMTTDWRSIRSARYLILSNSSFSILPALINNNVRKIIAPLHWGRRNTGVWATAQNYYGKFQYI